MQRAITLLAFTAILSLFSGCSTPRHAAKRAELKAVFVSGEAMRMTGETQIKLAKSEILRQGDSLKTAPGSYVDLELKGRYSIRLNPESGLDIMTCTLSRSAAEEIVATKLDMYQGNFVCNVQNLSKNSKFEIRNRAGIIGIRGSRTGTAAFSISYDGVISVAKGAATIIFPTGGIPRPPQTVEAGQTIGLRTSIETMFNPVPTPPDLARKLARDLQALEKHRLPKYD